jgi:hypothetical protein
MKKLVLIAMLAATASAWADGVQLLTPVTYASESSVVPKVREACKVEERLATDVSGTLGGSTTSTAGTVARVSILDVVGIGGGGWTGPKVLTIRVELLKDGKVEHTTQLTRTTTGGAFAGFKGTCSMLERDANTLAKDVANWVNNQ